MKKLVIEKYALIPGKCYLCGNEIINKEAYLHYACALAYDDMKRQKQKEHDTEN